MILNTLLNKIKSLIRKCTNYVKYGLLWRMRGYYVFKLFYFDKWALYRLKRYLCWQIGDLRRELNQFSADEFKSLKSFLQNEFSSSGGAPGAVMDFGCGLGRSSVSFMHMFKWYSTKFLLVDGHKTVYGPKVNITDSQRLFHHDVNSIFKQSASFYTDFDLIDRFVVSNKMSCYDLVDINKERGRLEGLQVDLFYSFHAIGYHWEMSATFDHYQLHDLVKPGGLLIFGIRQEKDYDNLGSHQLEALDSFLEKGYEKVALIEGACLQRFLVLRKMTKGKNQ